MNPFNMSNFKPLDEAATLTGFIEGPPGTSFVDSFVEAYYKSPGLISERLRERGLMK